jgi:leucyl/phenylalanyl-tRNA--protein transferase
MVLQTPDFRLHTSLRKQIRSLLKQQRLDIRMDHDFEAVIRSCANRPHPGQGGTWILPEMIQAYIRLHHQGLAHSVEAWIDGELAGGLYAVNLGRMVYGESMFSRSSNASKMALSALVGFCRQHRMPLIDCQQETAHLASMGAAPIDRKTFCAALEALVDAPSVHWRFDPLYWPRVLD